MVERLVEIDHHGQLVPRLATGWQWLDDRTLVMTLRHGVTFHNGEVFDAAMVKRNWDEYHPVTRDCGGQDGLADLPRGVASGDPRSVHRSGLCLPNRTARPWSNSASRRMMNRQFWRERWWLDIGERTGVGSVGHRTVQGGWKAMPQQAHGHRHGLCWKPIWPIGMPPGFPGCSALSLTHTLTREAALELVKTSEGQVDLVADMRPLETLRVAQSPFAKVVKERSGLRNVFGLFNMHKPGSPWQDVRLRQAVNYAINRDDLIRYAAKGNGTIVPALLPPGAFGYVPDLTPYPFDPAKARTCSRKRAMPTAWRSP